MASNDSVVDHKCKRIKREVVPGDDAAGPSARTCAFKGLVPVSKDNGQFEKMKKCQFVWQCEYDSRWMTYPAEHLLEINKSFSEGHKTVTVPVECESLTIAFENMMQKNSVNSVERRIRCCVYDKGFYVWQWKDDDGKWCCYSPSISLKLEFGLKLKKLVGFSLENDYIVDTSTMIQTNVTTKRKHKVERLKLQNLKLTKPLEEIGCNFESFINTMLENERDFPSSCKRLKRETVPDDDAHTAGPSTVTYAFKGLVPVSKYCGLKNSSVYSDKTGFYDAMLNQTNLRNNNNKFYHLQLLREEGKYFVFYNWGRVGLKGQMSLIPFATLKDAITNFTDKFFSKTSNVWEQRFAFVKKEGKYDLVEMDHGAEVGNTICTSLSERKGPISKVDALLELISDVSSMQERVVEMKYDIKRAPLGKLTEKQILAGLESLKHIEDILSANKCGSELVQACNEFYTRIPHDFRMKRPNLISTTEEIEEKLVLLELLKGIELNVRILNDCEQHNRLQVLYKSLECQLKPLNKNNSMFKVIKTYFLNTHGPTHNNYSMQLMDIFECKKKNEEGNFQDLGNNYLLWHGSRLTNFVGILKKGLQIAPKEAPSTGFMFGKGVYFADVSSKSANYNYPTHFETNGLLLLCQVSLGKTLTLYKANGNPGVVDSVAAEGKFVPNPKETIKMGDLNIPQGCLVSNENYSKCDLMYNEYVVYKESQVKLKYLVHFQFCRKR